MNLISILYGLFLLSTAVIYWSIKQQYLRLGILLIASLAFYTSLQTIYLPLLLALTFINFRLGIALGQNTPNSQDWHISNEEWQFAHADWNRKRLLGLWLGIILNVGLLLGFKYIGGILHFFDPQNTQNFKIISPLGISFFTFECIAYLIDVYRGAPATTKFFQFAAYKFFFPKLISGPITRYHNFATQLQNLRLPTVDTVAESMWLIARGAIKKAVFADHLGIFVDLCFSNLQRAGSGDLWLATFAYGLQLYLDFSGYVDIARGSALLFGLTLPENFDAPYFSTSIADFWRRWHMTLGDWLRNYLYFPLGGSRRGLDRTCLNLLIVMFVAGIWHGSLWGFVVWGVIHGWALVIHRLTYVMAENSEPVERFWQNPLGIVIAWLLTQITVFTSWIWFRLPKLEDSVYVVQNLWGKVSDAQFIDKVYTETLNITPVQLTGLLSLLFLLMFISSICKRQLKLQFNWPLKLVFVPLGLYCVWVLAPEGSLPYIYFDF
ncbi:MBOAT family O-acyltransferase [Calothrix sp. 336/3]|uniref:MBOAT family O-acyltransferase n=1 Tax=Calothrix sp. 336/3 TaxID=1337936 RepID=UPI0004E2ABF0|nr:MBOAT family protein [Calothrix sp. 336/3]AKG20564.1 alginate O-acetyltransferase [Calothrix sp. 336/3]